MLGTLIATAVAESVIKNAGKALTTAAVVGGTAAVAAAGVKHAKQKRLAAQVAGLETQNQQLMYEKALAERAELDRRQREHDEAVRQRRIARENAKKQAEAAERQRQMEMETTLKQLYAKFAICYYIALADGVIVDEERAELDRLCLDIYNKFHMPEVKQELLKIYNTPNMSFIVLEKYIRDVDPVVIASFLTLAEEMASLDGNASDKEKQCIYKLRKHLTDVTGYDYLGNQLHLDTAVNMDCPGCGSPMKLVPYDGKAVCPYCGRFKYLQSAKHS